MNRTQGPIESLLPHGEGNAIRTAQLVALAGCGSARQLQKLIEAERAHGALILSSSTGGYFLPSSDPDEARAEIKAFVATVTRRAVSSLSVLESARAALRVLPGQGVLGDG